MASYTNVPDSVLEPGDPIRSVDIIAIKDNIEHYAENNGATTVFTSSGTWTKPATVKRVKITVISAGGNGGTGDNPAVGAHGGGGGGAIKWIPAPTIPGPVSVTVGTAPSKTSSFGGFASATGGTNGANFTPRPFGEGGPIPAPAASTAPGGSGSGGDINLSGQSGKAHPAVGYATAAGQSALGFGIPSVAVADNGEAGFLYGGGGRGSTGTGGAGGAGIVIVEEFY
jgi:hypothetical protein